MENIIFIHYGSNKLNYKKFKKIKNRKYFNKPKGGLWASPLNSNNSWKDFCLDSNFRVKNLNNFFKFKIKKNSKILVINSLENLKQSIDKYGVQYKILNGLSKSFLDFEKLRKNGIDAIYLTENGEKETKFNYKTDLYGWDVESLLVLNPEIIMPINERRLKIPNRSFRKSTLLIKTNKIINVENPDNYEWKIKEKYSSSYPTTCAITGKNMKSKKTLVRNFRRILRKTGDDNNRIIKLIIK